MKRLMTEGVTIFAIVVLGYWAIGAENFRALLLVCWGLVSAAYLAVLVFDKGRRSPP